MDDVVVAYKRVGESYTGEIFLRSGEERSTGTSFEDKSYAWIMARFAEVLKEHPSYGGVMDVLSGSRYIRHRVDIKTAVLLRTDPAAAISSMHHEPRVVIVKDVIVPAVVDWVEVSVKIGHDTLADAFGDNIYLRLKDEKVEFPFDGRWKSFTSQITRGHTKETGEPWEREALWIPGYHGHVPERAVWISPSKVTDSWAVVPTDVLLEIGKIQGIKRYYLPRAWNQSGGWISHEDLQTKYDEYLKEKEDVSTAR